MTWLNIKFQEQLHNKHYDNFIELFTIQISMTHIHARHDSISLHLFKKKQKNNCNFMNSCQRTLYIKIWAIQIKLHHTYQLISRNKLLLTKDIEILSSTKTLLLPLLLLLLFKNWLQCKWATSWEKLFLPYANNKGADQPAHPRSLISAFVIRYLDSIISLVSTSKISSLYLASVAAQAGLCLPW